MTELDAMQCHAMVCRHPGAAWSDCVAHESTAYPASDVQTDGYLRKPRLRFNASTPLELMMVYSRPRNEG